MDKEWIVLVDELEGVFYRLLCRFGKRRELASCKCAESLEFFVGYYKTMIHFLTICVELNSMYWVLPYLHQCTDVCPFI
ncbi:Os02g0174900 [Oryza sativa Japonica Group]|uniref:Os02g0174900 protein n=1 Tax=Oryza sativa subsp. japonica TaxID=39947 RepID=A0A0P0VFQ9_ORYSJ|nr:hypothetical protein EE612_009183 [Oryza sativa]BAS77239.1 Os02g0174900 [Oryza sativa Japonica Group]